MCRWNRVLSLALPSVIEYLLYEKHVPGLLASCMIHCHHVSSFWMCVKVWAMAGLLLLWKQCQAQMSISNQPQTRPIQARRHYNHLQSVDICRHLKAACSATVPSIGTSKLDHKVGDDAMEVNSVVEARLRQVYEVGSCAWHAVQENPHTLNIGGLHKLGVSKMVGL